MVEQRGLALITLEPREGLSTITSTVAIDLAHCLATYNRKGVPIFVRFAHEMNGSCYQLGASKVTVVANLP